MSVSRTLRGPAHPRILLPVLLVLLSAPLADAAQQGIQGQIAALSRSVRTRYNRVEGFFAGYRLGITRPGWHGVSLFAEAGYGSHSSELRWEGGAEYVGTKNSLSVAFFDRTETNDRELIRTGENSLFALLYKGSYRDYFRAKNGFEIKGAYRRSRRLLLLGRLIAFTYVSMPVETQWSLFYPNREFRLNPQIQPGDGGLFQVGFILDTRVRSPIFRNAWYTSGVFERGFRDLGYNGLTLAFKRFQKTVFGSQTFVLQGRLGTRESRYEQHLFDLGGVSTLRGYGFKEFTGNRMLMVNFDYLFQGDILGRLPIRGSHLLNLILFFDTGWTTSVSRSKSLLNGFQELSLGDFKSDVGVSISSIQQWVRLNLARRLDRSNEAWTFSVRLLRKF